MHLDGWTLLLQAINLAVLLALLRWLLYKPLLAVIAQRQEGVNKQMAAVDAARHSAEQETQALASQRAEVDASREKILDAARAQAQTERQALLDSARATVQAEQTDARSQIDTERRQAGEALMNEASAIAVALTTRLINTSPQPTDDADFIEALLDRAKATPAAERQRWLDGVEPARITLVCAKEPNAATVQHVKESMGKTLSVAVDLQTEIRPALLRGAELHFPHGVLALSWSAELAQAEAEMKRAARNTA